MGFIEDHGIVIGQQAAFELLVAEGEVGEEEMVIDDDDVAFGGALVHEGDEAALKVGALLAAAELAARVDLGPGGAALRQGADFGAIADFGGLLPVADDLEIGHFLQAVEDGFLVGVVDLLAAGVVVAALHVADLQGAGKMLLEEGDILEKELLLEIFGASGDHDAFA